MATSESDDFESADEEFNTRRASARKTAVLQIRNTVDSESDDDTEFIPTQPRSSTQNTTCDTTKEVIYKQNLSNLNDDSTFIRTKSNSSSSEPSTLQTDECESKLVKPESEMPKDKKKVKIKSDSKPSIDVIESEWSKGNKNAEIFCSVTPNKMRKDTSSNVQRQQQPKQVRSFGANRLGTVSGSSSTINRSSSDFKVAEDGIRKAKVEGKFPPPIKNSKTLEKSSKKCFSKENTESEVDDIPDELKSNLKFIEIFKPDGWEHFDIGVELPDLLTEEKITPILEKLSSASESQDESNNSWSGWGSWDVGSLLNTASASVSTLTNRVSQGLTLLEETMGPPDPVDLVKVDMNQQANPTVNGMRFISFQSNRANRAIQ